MLNSTMRRGAISQLQELEPDVKFVVRQCLIRLYAFDHYIVVDGFRRSIRQSIRAAVEIRAKPAI